MRITTTAAVVSFLIISVGARRLGKSSKAKSSKSSSKSSSECRDILYNFNIESTAIKLGFGSGTNSLARTQLAGDLFLLAKPAKAFVIYQTGGVCDSNSTGVDYLDTLVARAEATASGCDDHPVAGLPIGAFKYYKQGRQDVAAITDMMCSTALECWKTFWGLAQEDCWDDEFSAPVLSASCLNNVTAQTKTTCDCLNGYKTVYHKLSR